MDGATAGWQLNAQTALTSTAMKELMQGIWSRLTVGFAILFALAGCQSWQSSTGIPGLGFSKVERQIVKQAKNDPFPSPKQVGMEAPQRR